MKKPKRRKNKTAELARKSPARYWLAINGASAAVSPIPFEKVAVRPKPQMLIGYVTRDEQLDAQRLLLNAPMDEVNAYMAKLKTLAEDGVVTVETFSKPKPPTSTTQWMPIS